MGVGWSVVCSGGVTRTVVYVEKSGGLRVERCGTCFWSQVLGRDCGECYCDHLLDIVDCDDKCDAYIPDL